MNPVAEPAAEAQAAPPEVHAPRAMPRGRLGPWWKNAVVGLIGPPWQRRLAQAALMVPRIRAWERRLEKLSDADLKTAGLRLRGRARRRSARPDCCRKPSAWCASRRGAC